MMKAIVRVVLIGLLAGVCLATDKEQPPKPAQSIPELQQQLEKILKDKHVPGVSVAIVKRDGPEWVGGVGLADVASKTPATADTQFRIGSTSKAFASLSILKLANQGKLSLTDPVHRLAPEVWFENPWEATNPVLVVDLLEHTTGWDDLHLREYAKNAPASMGLREGLDYDHTSRVSRWPPGTRMAYCNSGPPVAAYIVEKITGKRFEDYVAENFFQPIGMKSASYFQTSAPAATLYHDYGKTPFPYWNILLRPAGSINASANDMAAYVAFYLNRGAQEIGDTWIHGAPSDPLKLARYREVARLRESWLSQGKFRIGDVTDLALLRSLLLEVEHTWGTDTKTWLDFDHYTPAQLAPMLETKNYKVVEFSWAEKRQDLFDGIATLPAPLRQQAQDAVSGLAAKEPQASPASLHPASEMIDTRYFVVGIDPKSGAITRLRNKQSGREWASPLHPLALFSYQTLSQQDYSRFFANYVVSNEDWAKKDFGKPNIERFGAESREWQPTLRELHVEENGGGYRVLASVAIDDADAFTSGRASFPRKLYLELILPNASPLIELNFYWFQKPATRLPESVWLSFNPVVSDPRLWMLDKSGVQVSPLDVVAAGNRHMHALDKGFSYLERNASFAVETLDAPVVALGEKSPLNFSTGQPDLVGGIHCNLFNNAWGTNYIMWFGEDMRFRFVLRG